MYVYISVLYYNTTSVSITLKMISVSCIWLMDTKNLIIGKQMGQLNKVPQQILKSIIKLLSLEWVSHATLSTTSILITVKDVLKMMVSNFLMAQWQIICLSMQEMQVWFLCWEDPLEGEMSTHSSIFAWDIPWTEEPGVHAVTKS